MNQSDIDLFLAAFLGGVAGAGALVSALYFHFQALYRRYREAREVLWDVAALRKAQTDIEKLKQGMKAVSKELYERYEKEGE